MSRRAVRRELAPCLPAALAFRFIHRIIGGGFSHSASAGFGARAAVQATMLVDRGRASLMPQLTSRCSTFPAQGPSTGRPCQGAAKLSVSNPRY